MKVLELKLRLPGLPALTAEIRAALLERELFEPLPHTRAFQIRGTPMAGSNWLMAQVQSSAVFISDDWSVSFHGRRLTDCIEGMCTVITALGQELATPVEISMMESSSNRSNALYRYLDRERALRRALGVGLWLLTLAAGGVVGSLLQWAIG